MHIVSGVGEGNGPKTAGREPFGRYLPSMWRSRGPRKSLDSTFSSVATEVAQPASPRERGSGSCVLGGTLTALVCLLLLLPTLSSVDTSYLPRAAQTLEVYAPAGAASSTVSLGAHRRIISVFVVESVSDAVAARARISVQAASGVEGGFIVAQPTRTARGLLLSPLGLDAMLQASNGTVHLEGCREGSSSRCAHAPLPPLPHDKLSPSDIAAWQRATLLSSLGGWTEGGAKKVGGGMVEGLSWWPLRPSDVVVYFQPSVVPHPDALRTLSRVGAQAVPLPVNLERGGEFLYHLGWAATTSSGSSTGWEWSGGEAFEAAAAIAGVGATPPSPSTTASPLGPASALLALFGGVDAVTALRLAHGEVSPLWDPSFGPMEAAVGSSFLKDAITGGRDMRGRGAMTGETAATSATSTVLSAAPLHPHSTLEFAAMLVNASSSSSRTCLTTATQCIQSLPEPAQPLVARTRYLHSCLSGRLGNYFINLLNSFALARASRRTVIASSLHNKEHFPAVFQSTRVPWTPYPPQRLSLPELGGGKGGMVCLQTYPDSHPHACGANTPLTSWVSQSGGNCVQVLGMPPRSPHPHVAPMLRLFGVGEEEVLNPATHPQGTRGAAYPVEVLEGGPGLVAQAFNYYDYDYVGENEWLETRCGLDFSTALLGEVWRDFVGPRGPLKGEPFFSLHARLEDFAGAYPGEDTAPTTEDFVGYAIALARKAGLKRVFVATNGTPQEREGILAQINNATTSPEGKEGHMEAWVHPKSEDYHMGKYYDAAVAGYASGFLGNKISTYSYIIGGQLACAGRVGEVYYFRARDYARLKKSQRI